MSLESELPAVRLETLQEQIGYRFRNLDLLRQALVHKSWLNEVEDLTLLSNERLEFLGDAILGAVVGRELFDRFPTAPEGWLTMSRAQIVRNRTLALVAEVLDLGSYLLMGAGIENEGARSRPRVLSRTLEAVFGAVWLDGGDAAARDVILRLFDSQFCAMSAAEIRHDAKSQLQQLTQAESGRTPIYEIIDESGPPHSRRFRAQVLVKGEVAGIGEGTSKQDAEMAAAAAALETIGSQSGSTAGS